MSKVILKLNKFFKKYPKFSLVLLIAILFLFSFWFTYLYVFVSSPLGVISIDHEGDWLQWMGGFIGGALGGILAFVGIKITLDNQRREIEFENKKKALPYIDVKKSEFDYKNRSIGFDFNFTEESNQRERRKIEWPATINFSIENVGLRELYELHIGDISSEHFNSDYKNYSLTPIVYVNKSLDITFKFYEKGLYDNDSAENLYNTLVSPIIFKCYYRDCYDNWYYQQLSVAVMHTVIPCVTTTEKALNIDLERSEILSSPTEIPTEELPWKKGESILNY